MFFNLTFEKPIGSPVDVKELEYITALHQSGNEEDIDWSNPSINAKDVKAFLMSRYGILVQEEEVLQLIFSDLAGGGEAHDCIDISELVAILLIPYLVKTVTDIHPEISKSALLTSTRVNKYKKEHEELVTTGVDGSSMITYVLRIILEHATGSIKPQPLTKELVKKIFARYNELDLVIDEDLIDEMIQVATDGQPGALFDETTFARALTSDVGLYDVNKEARISTHYQDVFGRYAGAVDKETPIVVDKETLVSSVDALTERHYNNAQTKDSDVKDNDHIDEEEGWRDKAPSNRWRKVKKVLTLSQIDFLAGTFRMKTQYVLVWVGLILFTLSYLNTKFSYPCSGKTDIDFYVCVASTSVGSWMVTFITYIIIGSLFVLTLSQGNHSEQIKLWEVLIGISGIILFIFVPSISIKHEHMQWEFYGISIIDGVKNQEGYRAPYPNINYVIGSLLLLLQIWNLLRVFSPRIATKVYQGSSIHDEFGIKIAAKKKIYQMVKNAYELRKDSQSHASCLLNYNKIIGGEKTVTVGGFSWGWKALVTRKIVREEGVWIPSRLMAGNVIQLIIIIALFIGFMRLNAFGIKFVYEDIPDTFRSLMTNPDINCRGSFNHSNCHFPQDEAGKYIGVAICKNVGVPTCNEGQVENKVSKFLAKNMRVENATISNKLLCSLLDSPYAQVYSEYSTLNFFDDAQHFSDYAEAYSRLNFSDPEEVLELSQSKFSDLVQSYVEQYPIAMSIPKCPELLVPHSPAYVESTVGSFGNCTAPVTACISTKNDSDVSDTCILGLMHNNFLSPRFIGEACRNHTIIKEIIEDNKLPVSKWSVSKPLMKGSLYTGAVAAFIFGTMTVIAFIPSLAITVLKFRTGVIPLLRHNNFCFYRENMHRASSLLGAMMWGAFASFIGVSLLLSLLIFFTFWESTRKIVWRVLSILAAVAITMMARTIIVIFFKRTLFQGFYRKKNPALINILNLMIECWDLAITAGYVIVRFAKILVITYIYIGRFDIPLLSDLSNRAGPLYIDMFPLILRANLLAIESHRHPYIERLGLLYMMKLKYGDAFGRRSGSTWRLLFVFALMPWLQKYRISNNENDNNSEDEEVMSKAMIGEMYGLVPTFDDMENEIDLLKNQNVSLQNQLEGEKMKSDHYFQNMENKLELLMKENSSLKRQQLVNRQSYKLDDNCDDDAYTKDDADTSHEDEALLLAKENVSLMKSQLVNEQNFKSGNDCNDVYTKDDMDGPNKSDKDQAPLLTKEPVSLVTGKF